MTLFPGKGLPKIDMQLCSTVRSAHATITAYYASVAAAFYENRGQVEQAINEWRVAELLNDENTDSLACQALLKSSNATDHDKLQAQGQWAKRHALSPETMASASFEPYNGRRRITIGYVCAWWDSTTIRGQAIPFISLHDKSKFRVIGYSRGPCDRSDMRHFDEFKVVGRLSHREFASLVRNDKVDILVEFTGFSPNHRFAAMGARCAPVQVSYLNHAGTSGVPNVDYVIADEVAAPSWLEPRYSEEILRLPGTFFNFNYDWDTFPSAGPPPCLRTGHVTFGCFGSQSKINDAQVYMWAKLLQAVPHARLFLRNRGLDPAENRDFMARRFAQWGIDKSRLRIEPGGDRYSILRSYADVDISLDTWPYNGGNTIAESLWQGVPVLTMLGDGFNSRYGASLLRASGCADLVADDIDGLIAVARSLSRDVTRLEQLRRELRQMMRQHGFADSERFCRSWEEALRAALMRAAG
jgi:predicted O-linked N-acetylglucosamine transferase (SPINDLY family)